MQTWSYLFNPFEVLSKRSLRKLLIFATDHYDKLSALSANDVFLQTLFQTLEKPFQEFSTSFQAISSTNSTYQSKTQVFETKIIELSAEKIKRWDIKIQNEFLEGTEEYKSILPQGRKPFQTGMYEERVAAVQTLAQKLKNYAILSALQTEINDYALELRSLRSEQQGKEVLSRNAEIELRQKAASLIQAMHRIFGGLIWHFGGDTQRIESLYELRWLRNTSKGSSTEQDENEVISKVLAPEETKVLLEIKEAAELTEERIISVSDKGESVSILRTDDINTPVNEQDSTNLLAGNVLKTSLADIGGKGTNYILVKNNSKDEETMVDIV